MSAPTVDRADLIHAAQTGDAGSVERLLAVCQADARRYAHRHCQASDVDDAVQEALLTLSRKVKGLKAATAFSSRLFVVIKRECRRLERIMFRRDRLPDELAEEQMLSRPDASLRIDLARALESLPSHYLKVVLLRDFEELTIGRDGAALGRATRGGQESAAPRA